MIAVELTVPLRQLIDARLDNIERALMTQAMSRGDRQQILAAIEEQIFEMLDGNSKEEPTRDDVLAVLAKLDPPEAYLEPMENQAVEPQQRRTLDRSAPFTSEPTPPVKSDWNMLAVIALVATCLACVGAMTWWIVGFAGLLPLVVVTSVAQTCGVVAVCQIQQRRTKERGFWMAVIGCCSLPLVVVLALFTVVVLDIR
jgi:hypothetical protein